MYCDECCYGVSEFDKFASAYIIGYSPYPELNYSNVLSSDDPSLAKKGIRKRRGDPKFEIKTDKTKQQN